MKPGVERQATGTLPHARAVSTMACATSGAVACPDTTSTSGSKVAGLKKCMPTTRSGRPSRPPSAVTDSDDVLVATMASAGSCASMCFSTATFASRSSTITSITRPTAERSVTPSIGRMRWRMASRAAASSRPRSTRLSRPLRIMDRPRASAASLASRSHTTWPAAAATSAMPLPMVPAPMTTTARSFASGPPIASAPQCGPLGELDLGDRVAMHLVGPVDDAHRALVRIGLGEPEVGTDAGGAVRLDRPVDHLARDVGSHHLDHRDLRLGGLVAGHVHHMRGLQREQARLVDHAPGFGDALVPDRLLGQRLAERGALLQAVHHHLER